MKSRADTYIANENAVYATAPTRMLLRVCGEEAKVGAHKTIEGMHGGKARPIELPDGFLNLLKRFIVSKYASAREWKL